MQATALYNQGNDAINCKLGVLVATQGRVGVLHNLDKEFHLNAVHCKLHKYDVEVSKGESIWAPKRYLIVELANLEPLDKAGDVVLKQVPPLQIQDKKRQISIGAFVRSHNARLTFEVCAATPWLQWIVRKGKSSSWVMCLPIDYNTPPDRVGEINRWSSVTTLCDCKVLAQLSGRGSKHPTRWPSQSSQKTVG